MVARFGHGQGVVSTLPRLLGMGLSGLALLTVGAGTARRAVPWVGAPVGPDRISRSTVSANAPAAEAVCPPLTLPDNSICVHVPAAGEDELSTGAGGGDSPVAGRQGNNEDEIPRRPDRPPDYAAYWYPVRCSGCVLGAGDLDRSASLGDPQRTRPGQRAGVDLAVARDTPVTLLTLEHQQGPAELVYVGPLLGQSIVTRHSVREANDERNYIVILAHVDVTPSLATSDAGAPRTLRSGELLGLAGDRGTSGAVHLRMEVRRIRKGVDVRGLRPAALVDGANTIACDPRNVLPLK